MQVIRQIPSAWKPPPLRDSSSQIRLLWIHAGHKEDEIRCTVSAWDLEDAPGYRAISYAWGSPSPDAFVNITSMTLSSRGYGFDLVDFTRVKVRENARYALWQARLHYPNSYLWIDSICIDQSDLSEKAEQVAMMAMIYAKAEAVIACIGPSDDSSDAVFDSCYDAHKWLSESRDHGARLPADVSSEGCQESHEPLHTPIDFEDPDEVLGHLQDFFARRYWSRLWIIQELHSGWNRLVVSCGDQSITFDVLLGLISHLSHLGFCEPWDPDLLPILGVLQYVTRPGFRGSAMDLDVFWDYLTPFSCADVRDRIYGALGLFAWELAGVSKPLPDYQISTFNLAVRLLPETGAFHVGRAASIMAALELDKCSTDDLIRHFVASKRVARSAESGSITGMIDVQLVCLIQQDNEGGLCIPFDHTEFKTVPVAVEENPYVGGEWISATWLDLVRRKKLVQLLNEDPASIVVWPKVEPGDLLIGLHRHFIVVRPTQHSTRFRIVGHAICPNAIFDEGYYTELKSWSCDCWSSNGRMERRPYLRASVAGLTRADALMLAAFRVMEANPVSRMDRNLLNIPAIGSYMEDVSRSLWKTKEWKPREHEALCSQHEAEDREIWRRNPMSFCGKFGCRARRYATGSTVNNNEEIA